MKIRKLVSVVALSGALVLGTAATAAADVYSDPVNPGVTAPITGVTAIPAAQDLLDASVDGDSDSPEAVEAFLAKLPAHLVEVVRAHIAGGAQVHYITHPASALTGVFFDNGTPLVPGTDYNVYEGSAVIALTPAFLARHAGNFNLHAVFSGGAFRVALPTRGTAPTGGGDVAADVRPVHPATGPATVLYGVGGLLLAGGGVSLVAAGKRRKAELV